MNRLYFGIFLVALMTLVTQLALTRAFDVILIPNLAYMIITCAMFSYGLSGIVATLIPLPIYTKHRAFLSILALLLALSTLSILPITNVLPFDYKQISESPLVQAFAFGGMYGVLLVPFFLSGLIVTTLIARYPENIQSLYFWDLTGAAIGCVILIPILPFIGPGGILFCAAALAVYASGLFSESRLWLIVSKSAAVAIIIIPFYHWPDYIDFREHVDKRGVKKARELGRIEFTRWDPISKIDVIPEGELTAWSPRTQRKHIAYDGGSQGSIFWPFNGNYQELRDNVAALGEHFSTLKVLASHYLKRDTQQKVFIIGSAGGVEIKAALMYGAARVDAVEMVGTVVELGKTKYAAYIGNIFNHPKVHVGVGEGRSVLRASREKYDIIQMFSNHTSSSIAAGTGAMAPVYLQTAEAYREYFTHLTDNGVLHINHYAYPRMVTTAALAWKQLGRTDFQKHVVVFELKDGDYVDYLPTFLVKMKPWTAAEVNELKRLLFTFPMREDRLRLVEDPLHPEESFLSPAFYAGDVPRDLMQEVQYRLTPAVDDRPYFAFLRKSIGTKPVQPDPEKFMSPSMAGQLNWQRIGRFLTMDTVHLVVTAACSLFYAGLFIVLPLYFSNVGRTKWPGKGSCLLYFSCLGSGFIIFELVFIHVFMHFIGFPLYTYATVIFTLLVAAGIGSGCSRRLGISVTNRWSWPFLGILISGISLLVSHSYIFDSFLGSATAIRVIVAALVMFPLGFFLGMPFPLGILALQRQPQGAIAWAWGLNGLFTVIGGLASVLVSLFLGFKITLLVALTIYLIAFWLFSKFRQVSLASASV
jgi:hypothetical protein